MTVNLETINLWLALLSRQVQVTKASPGGIMVSSLLPGWIP